MGLRYRGWSAVGRVVERLDVVEHCPGEFGAGVPLVPVEQLALQRGKERLGDRVVESVTNGAHRAEQAGTVEPLPEHP